MAAACERSSGREGGGGKGGGGEGGGGEGGGGEGGGKGGGSEGGGEGGGEGDGCEGGGRWARESMRARRGRGAARVRARAAGAHRFQMGRPRYMKIGTSAVHGMHTGPMQMKGIAWHSSWLGALSWRPRSPRGVIGGRNGCE